MSHAIQLIPTHQGVGLTSSIIGLFYAYHRLGIKTAYFKPIQQSDTDAKSLLQPMLDTPLADSISAERADELLSENKTDVLLEEIIITCEKLKAENQIVIIGGLLETKDMPYATELNRMIAKAIGADVVLATDAIGVNSLAQFEHKLEFAATEYGGTQSLRVLGTIINRLGEEDSLALDEIKQSKLFTDRFRLLGAVPSQPTLNYPRTLDVIDFLDAKVLNEGDANTRRIAKFTMIARTIPNAISHLTADSLIITPADRSDVIMATTLAAASGHQIAGLVLTGETNPTPAVMALCVRILRLLTYLLYK